MGPISVCGTAGRNIGWENIKNCNKFQNIEKYNIIIQNFLFL